MVIPDMIVPDFIVEGTAGAILTLGVTFLGIIAKWLSRLVGRLDSIEKTLSEHAYKLEAYAATVSTLSAIEKRIRSMEMKMTRFGIDTGLDEE